MGACEPPPNRRPGLLPHPVPPSATSHRSTNGPVLPRPLTRPDPMGAEMLVRVSFNRGCSCKWPVHSGLRTHPCTASSDDFGLSVGRRGGCHPVYGDGSRVVRGADRDSVVFLMWVACVSAEGGPRRVVRFARLIQGRGRGLNGPGSPGRLRRQSHACPGGHPRWCRIGGGCSAPAGQEVEHHQPDRH
jgi:hypothetical protein